MVVYFLYSRACYVLWSSILHTVGHVCVMVVYFLYSRHVCVMVVYFTYSRHVMCYGHLFYIP